MKHLSAILVTLLALAGCTTTDEIIIDEKSVDMTKYRQDLAECRSYASQVKTGEKTAKGAASGAVVGGLTGAIFGGSQRRRPGRGRRRGRWRSQGRG